MTELLIKLQCSQPFRTSTLMWRCINVMCPLGSQINISYLAEFTVFTNILEFWEFWYEDRLSHFYSNCTPQKGLDNLCPISLIVLPWSKHFTFLFKPSPKEGRITYYLAHFNILQITVSNTFLSFHDKHYYYLLETIWIKKVKPITDN